MISFIDNSRLFLGAVPEMFGWPHKDAEKECELMAKAGYLGVKLFPVDEQLMSYQPFSNNFCQFSNDILKW